MVLFLYTMLIIFNNINVLGNMPFTSNFWGSLMFYLAIIFVLCNVNLQKKSNFFIIFICISLFVIFTSFVENMFLKFTELEKVMDYNGIDDYDYIRLDDIFIIFNHNSSQKHNLRTIYFKKSRYENMKLVGYNPIYSIDDKMFNIYLYDIKNYRIILVENMGNESLSIKDSQSNDFFTTNINNFTYYASIVQRQNDYVINVDGKEYEIDLLKSTEDYINDRVNNLNNDIDS